MRNHLRICVLTLVLMPFSFAAEHDKNHNDVFTRGSADETRIAREVRHELVMLPYYGVFDDLAFRVVGSTVTLLGSVTRPTLKSDAENVTKRIEGVTRVNGHVTLEGVVANQGDKNLINVRANSVPNVFSVTNDLQVEGGGK